MLISAQGCSQEEKLLSSPYGQKEMETQQTYELLESTERLQEHEQDCKDRGRYTDSAVKKLSGAKLGQTSAIQIQKNMWFSHGSLTLPENTASWIRALTVSRTQHVPEVASGSLILVWLVAALMSTQLAQ